MENQFNNYENPMVPKVLQFTGVVLRLFGFVIVGAYLSLLLLSIITGTNLMDSERMIFEIENGSEARLMLLLMQALNVVFVYITLPLIYIYVFQKDLKQIFLIRKKKLGKFILFSFFIFLSALPFISQLIQWNQKIQLPEKFLKLQQELLKMEEIANNVTNSIVLYDSWYEIIPILLVVAVLAGIGEELLFRGIIQTRFTIFI